MGILDCIKNIFKQDNRSSKCCVHKWDLIGYKHMRKCSKCGLRQYISYRDGKRQWVDALVLDK